MMPFGIRFGLAGVVGLLVALQLLGVVTLLAPALFGVPWILGIESAVKGAARFLTWLHRQLGPFAFSLVLVAAVLASNFASFHLSSWLYRRRDF